MFDQPGAWSSWSGVKVSQTHKPVNNLRSCYVSWSSQLFIMFLGLSFAVWKAVSFWDALDQSGC